MTPAVCCYSIAAARRTSSGAFASAERCIAAHRADWLPASESSALPTRVPRRKANAEGAPRLRGSIGAMQQPSATRARSFPPAFRSPLASVLPRRCPFLPHRRSQLVTARWVGGLELRCHVPGPDPAHHLQPGAGPARPTVLASGSGSPALPSLLAAALLLLAALALALVQLALVPVELRARTTEPVMLQVQVAAWCRCQLTRSLRLRVPAEPEVPGQLERNDAASPSETQPDSEPEGPIRVKARSLRGRGSEALSPQAS
jgi:hypothetical protein